MLAKILTHLLHEVEAFEGVADSRQVTQVLSVLAFEVVEVD